MKNAKRILLAVDALNSSGITFSLQNLITGLLPQGAKIMILARHGGEREQLFRKLPLEKIHISKYLGTPILGRGCVAAVKEFKPDIIHCLALNIFEKCHKLAEEVNVPILATVNRFEEDCSYLARNTGIKVLAISNAIKERLANREGIKQDRVKVIPNGLDLNMFPKPNLKKIDNGSIPVVGTFGKLDVQKGQRVFVETAAMIINRKVDAEFLIMGAGPDKQHLRKMVDLLGIRSRVTFNPPSSADNRNLGNIDIFVEPSFQEGLGLSVMQAMASGVPVIASGVGGIYELVEDGVTGVLVPKNDKKALEKAIIDLIEKPAKRHELARNAREKVEESFDIRKLAKNILALYSECLERRGGYSE
ncbi:MAG: glycosyltransferase family 4 protein [Planctomycetes bacterium]|nr:glycosyltransferase family 4 protein [Planctomycetota bacterium]